METPEIRTELMLIRRDVDDIKLLIPDIRNALQQLAVTNAQLVSNMDEHKIIWAHINNMKDKCEDEIIPHITVWTGHREEHERLDDWRELIAKEHVVCMARQNIKPETLWDKILPQLIVAGITALATGITIVMLIHASDILKVAR